jgi:hypothetical protein
MTDPASISPRSSLSDAANDIYVAVGSASRAGYKVEIDEEGRVDLVDQDGNWEPLFWAKPKGLSND